MKTIHFEEMPQWMAQLDEKVDVLAETVRQLYQELAKAPAAPAAPEQMVTIQQAAQILQLSVSRVRTLVQEGRVPCYKPGRNLLFRPSELHQWLTDSRRKGQPSIAEQMEAYPKACETVIKERNGYEDNIIPSIGNADPCFLSGIFLFESHGGILVRPVCSNSKKRCVSIQDGPFYPTDSG